MLAEITVETRTDAGVARIAAGESSAELEAYRARFREMESTET
jgi:hypothetical protein